MPKFIVIKGPLKGKKIDLGNETVFFGRNTKTNDISIPDITVSRKHFKVTGNGENIFIEDLKSKHGTLINGRRIAPGKEFQVKNGDLISIGRTLMRLSETSGEVPSGSDVQLPQGKSKGSAPEKQHGLARDKRSSNDLELIYKVSELFKEKIDIDELFKKAIRLLMQALPRADNAIVFIFGNDDNPFMEIISDSHDESAVLYSRKVLDQVIDHCDAVMIPDAVFEPPADKTDDENSPEIGSALCVPIMRGNDILGAIYIDSRKPNGFRKEDKIHLNILAGPMAIAIEKNWE